MIANLQLVVSKCKYFLHSYSSGKKHQLSKSMLEGNMGGSEYRNAANKIEQTPHHRDKCYELTDTAK